MAICQASNKRQWTNPPPLREKLVHITRVLLVVVKLLANNWM
jgi:hypothetical protein